MPLYCIVRYTLFLKKKLDVYMITFTATIEKFDQKGEKSGWSYIRVPESVALQLQSTNRKGFRVKGRLDEYSIAGISLLPMGEGEFILPLNGTIRKHIGKGEGATLTVYIAVDQTPLVPPAELLDCLADEPDALQHFNSLTKGHQNYFIKHIEAAKTVETRAKRIALAVTALSRKMDFGEMIRSAKKDREILGGI